MKVAFFSDIHANFPALCAALETASGLGAEAVVCAGDLASGVALRLHRCGFPVAMTELPTPLMVRRTVCFGEAVYDGQATVEVVVVGFIPPARPGKSIRAAGSAFGQTPNSLTPARSRQYAIQSPDERRSCGLEFVPMRQ